MTAKPRLLCVTPNLAVDRTLVVPGFRPGAVWRADRALAMAGGKGVNVARAARTLGYDALCAGPKAGPVGAAAARAAAEEGLPAHWTEIDGDSRVCVILVDPERGETTVINEPGRPIAAKGWAALARDLARLAGDCDAVCLGGSLPPGVPRGGYARLIGDLARAGRPVWVDTSGAALAEAAGAAPYGLKVNAAEAARLCGAAIDGPEQAAAAARGLLARGIEAAAITLGGDGAVLASGGHAWHAAAPPIEEVCAVGSGDAFLAGLAGCWAAGGSPEAALREAVGAGAANALSLGGGVFRAEDARRLAEAAALRGLPAGYG
jgi:1-phosphofructokinase family hexose kinase